MMILNHLFSITPLTFTINGHFNIISGGVFVVLLCGLALAILVAILEFCWNSKKNAQTDRQSLCSEMAEELRFAVRCHGSRQRPALRGAALGVVQLLPMCLQRWICHILMGPQRAATLNYRTTPQCPDLGAKSTSLGRCDQQCGGGGGAACDVVQSGLDHHQQNIPDKILWKFDCDISSPNNPDVVNRTLPDAVVSRTTTL
ncbi:hypothetical protein NQ317_003937 [Molorchus minor]|uniref:Uncharacterized protein n=1 Tax=Molorchus minor TaxID=1323400 RepID=A0ABQ9JCH0_9CUCU|nr:hypothetical protein NQ317_003937 [Molorchus minor]